MFKAIFSIVLLTMFNLAMAKAQCNANSQATLSACMNGAGFGNIQINGNFTISTTISFPKNQQTVITTNGYAVTWPTLEPNTVIAFAQSGGSGGSGNITINGTAYDINANSPPNLSSLNAQGNLVQSLPVELVSFTGRSCQFNTVVLNWHTASEQNNAGFEVQRSRDGENWEALTFVTGQGFSSSGGFYTYTDEHPAYNLNYYRLKQMDFGGSFEFSKVINIEIGNNNAGLTLFPNPATREVSLTLETDFEGAAILKIYNLIGEKIDSRMMFSAGKFYHDRIDLTGLTEGTYLLSVLAGDRHYQERLIVQ